MIAFDADDTLWVNMTLFFEAVEKVKKIIGKYTELTGISREIHKIEAENISSLKKLQYRTR